MCQKRDALVFDRHLINILISANEPVVENILLHYAITVLKQITDHKELVLEYLT